jgi:hypothetical protein
MAILGIAPGACCLTVIIYQGARKLLSEFDKLGTSHDVSGVGEEDVDESKV